MANNVVGSLIVNLGLETGRLNSDTQKAAKHFNGFDKKASRSLNNIKNRVKGLMGALGGLTGVAGILSVSGLGFMAKAAIDSADKIGKLSDRLGASTEALSQYQHVAELSGVTFETLTMGWQRMTRRVAEAANGTGEAKNALIELNLSAKDLNQLKPEDQFEAIADALSGVTNSADKVRLSMKLFDSGGVSLLQTMTKGAGGIKEMRMEADKLGLTLSREDAIGAAAANDAFTRLAASGKALGITFAKELGPTLADIANWASINLPQAVDFAKDALLGLKGVSELVIGGIAGLLGKYYGLFGLLPGKWGAHWKAMSEDFNGFSEFMNQKLDTTISKINEVQNFKGSASLSPGGNVGGAETGTAVEETKKAAELKALESLELSLLSEELRLIDSYSRRREIVRNALGIKKEDEERHDALMIQLRSEYQSKLTAIEKKGWTDRQKFDKKSGKDKSKQVIGDMINLTAGVSQQSRKMFELNKAAGIANAVINTYEGVSTTLKAYPWPLAGAMAALHLSAGLAQVSAIKGASFSGGGGAPSGITGGAGATIADTIQPVDTNTRDNGSQINIYIEGSAIGDEQVRQVIIEAVETAQANDEIVIRTGTGG